MNYNIQFSDNNEHWQFQIGVYLVCNDEDEANGHIFLNCVYNRELWMTFTIRIVNFVTRWLTDEDHDSWLKLLSS